jgi:hypothetical protein
MLPAWPQQGQPHAQSKHRNQDRFGRRQFFLQFLKPKSEPRILDPSIPLRTILSAALDLKRSFDAQSGNNDGAFCVPCTTQSPSCTRCCKCTSEPGLAEACSTFNTPNSKPKYMDSTSKPRSENLSLLDRQLAPCYQLALKIECSLFRR